MNFATQNFDKKELDRFQAFMCTPFATIGVATSDSHLTEVRLLPKTIAAKAPKKNSIAQLAITELALYLKNPQYQFQVPIKLSGSHHQLEVWRVMREIPPGEVKTYGAVASELGSSAQAIGGACGRNPIPIIVPCHRIVARHGLGGFMGYGEGDTINIKQWLLMHENAPIAKPNAVQGQLL